MPLESNLLQLQSLIAQIIPVLFVGISLQSSFFLKSKPYTLPTQGIEALAHAGSLVLFLCVLGAAEFLALLAIYTNKFVPDALIIETIALLLAAICIILDVVLGFYSKRKHTWLYLFFIQGLLIIGLLLWRPLTF